MLCIQVSVAASKKRDWFANRCCCFHTYKSSSKNLLHFLSTDSPADNLEVGAPGVTKYTWATFFSPRPVCVRSRLETLARCNSVYVDQERAPTHFSSSVKKVREAGSHFFSLAFYHFSGRTARTSHKDCFAFYAFLSRVASVARWLYP